MVVEVIGNKLGNRTLHTHTYIHTHTPSPVKSQKQKVASAVRAGGFEGIQLTTR